MLLLLLTIAAHAQTIKWGHTPPVPPFSQDAASLVHARGDTTGGIALLVAYTNLGSTTGLQVLWYSNTGKTLHIDHMAGSNVHPRRVISVTPAVLLVALQSGNDVFLRKYTRRGTVVTFKDTPLADGEEIDAASETLECNDRAGFFTILRGQGNVFAGFKRYTFR